jgi:hypothetical protein
LNGWPLHFLTLAQTQVELMEQEQRGSERCTIGSDEVQVSVSTSRKIYSVNNISKGGLAIEYNPLADEPFETKSIDIIAVGYGRIYMKKIASETVYDHQTLMHNNSFSGGVRRIRGLKFVELTEEQEDKLETLLKSCFKSPAQ